MMKTTPSARLGRTDTEAWNRLLVLLLRRKRRQIRMSEIGKDAFATADTRLFLHFHSVSGTPVAEQWDAEVEIPAFERNDWTEFPVHVSTPSAICPSPDGEFTLCGAKASIVNGHGKIDRKSFLAGLSAGGASFAASGHTPINGNPVLSSF